MRSRAACVAVSAVLAACLQPPGYRCDDDAQCVVAADGRCIDGFCAYPDPACEPAGLRYGELAPAEVAGACVDAGGSGEGDSSGGPPGSRCGNGELDEDESCDDGNREPGDACHPQCAVPGTILYTVTYDGAAHSEDKGYGLALDAARASFYVAGFATDLAAQGQDILLQRRWIEDGALVWSRSQAGDGLGNDNGENVAIDGLGNPVLVGVLITASVDGDIFVRKYDPDGGELWTAQHDEHGRFDRGQGVAVSTTGVVTVVGSVTLERGGSVDADAWMQRYADDGSLLGAPLLRGREGVDDEAIDADGDGDGWLVTGRLTDDAGEFTVWTARYDGAPSLLWEDFASADPIGDESRGVGMGVDPMGGSATAGALANDIWMRRYDPFGTPGTTIQVAGDQDIHDEAADVAFAPDGSFVVVGFVDFATDGFATADAWVRKYDAAGTEEWTDVHDGPAHEVDKALAVIVTDDLSAIVTGYQTVPGQARDVWIRRYAI